MVQHPALKATLNSQTIRRILLKSKNSIFESLASNPYVSLPDDVEIELSPEASDKFIADLASQVIDTYPHIPSYRRYMMFGGHPSTRVIIVISSSHVEMDPNPLPPSSTGPFTNQTWWETVKSWFAL